MNATNNRKILENSCKKKHWQDCAALAVALRQEDVSPSAIRRARDLLRQGCESGDQYSCYAETGYYFWGKYNIPVDHKKGHQLLGDSCDKGGYWSCETLARLHKAGEGVPASEEKYYEYLIKACDLFDWNSCEKASEGPRELLEKLGAYIVESPAEDAGSQNHPTKNNPMQEER